MEKETKLDSTENVENNVIHLGPPEGYTQQPVENYSEIVEEKSEAQHTDKESDAAPVDNKRTSGNAKT